MDPWFAILYGVGTGMLLNSHDAVEGRNALIVLALVLVCHSAEALGDWRRARASEVRKTASPTPKG